MEGTGLSSRLLQAFASTGMTQGDLALRLGVTQGAVSQWLSGRKLPPRDRVTHIAEVLGVSKEWIELGVGEAPPVDHSGGRAWYRDHVRWVFRREPADGGRDYGNANLWAFNWNIDALVREVGQNFSDVAVDPEAGVGAEFRIIRLTGEDLKQFLDALDWPARGGQPGLHDHLEAAAESGQKLGTVLRAGLEELGDPPTELLLLRIDDWGTRGLVGPEAGSGNFSALCRNNLHSEKQGAGTAGGSFGLGKAVLWRASRLSTVLFLSNLAVPVDVQGISRQDGRLFGRSDLSWHEVNGQTFAGPGWFGEVKYLADGSRAESVWSNAALAHDLYLERESTSPFEGLAATGTSILVVGFHDQSSDESLNPASLATEIAQATARYFWPALVSERLRVTVSTYEGRVQTGTHQVTVTDDKDSAPFAAALESYRASSTTANAEKLTDPGQVAEIRVPLRVPRKKAGVGLHPETDHEAILLVRRAMDGDPGGDLANSIAMYRGREMVLKYERLAVPGNTPFHAVLLCGQAAGSTREDGIAEQFLRTAEPPAHDVWRLTPELKAEYAQGGGTRISRFIDDVKQAVKGLVRPVVEDTEDGPQGLRELLRIGKEPAAGSAKPVVRVDPGKSHIDQDGRWDIRATVRTNGQRPWRVTPVLVFAAENGGGTPVEWTITADPPAKVDGQQVLIPKGARTIAFRGVSDPDSHPVAVTDCAVRVDLRNVQPA